MAPLNGHNLLQQVKRHIQYLCYSVFTNALDACYEMIQYKKKEIISPHTNYTDRIISKCNPDFILPISTPTLDVGAATPRRLVSTVGCIQSKKCFDDRRIGRGKNMHM